MSDIYSNVDTLAREMMLTLQERINAAVANALRNPTGVSAGGPFSHFNTSLDGKLAWATPSITTIASATNTSVATGSSDHDVPFDTGDTAGWVTGTPAMVLPYTGSVLVIVKMGWQLASGSPFTTLVGDHQLRIQQIRSASVFDELRYTYPANQTTGYFELRCYSAIFDVVGTDIINLQASHNAGVTLKCFGDVRIAYL